MNFAEWLLLLMEFPSLLCRHALFIRRSSMMRPSSSVTIRSAYCAILSSWVTSTMVWSRSRATRRSCSSRRFWFWSRGCRSVRRRIRLAVWLRTLARCRHAVAVRPTFASGSVHAFAEPYSFQHFLGDCLTLVFRHAWNISGIATFSTAVRLGSRLYDWNTKPRCFCRIPPIAVHSTEKWALPRCARRLWSVFPCLLAGSAEWICQNRIRRRYSRSACGMVRLMRSSATTVSSSTGYSLRRFLTSMMGLRVPAIDSCPS